MQRSEQINELTAALAAAQAEIEGAVKDKSNPHFRSKYADLGAVWDAIREPLTKNGLSVVQFPRRSAEGLVEIETVLAHKSGQFMSDVLALPCSKPDAQGVGSAITYGRRYSLMAVAGIAPVDDDANAAVGNAPVTQVKRDTFDYGESWKAWATAGKGSECEKWLKQAKIEIASATTTEQLDRWVSMETMAAKQVRALHDHHEERYDWLMKLVNDKRDELRAKEAA